MHPDFHDPFSRNIAFRLFGFPTIIQPFFWVIALLITALHVGGINDNMPIWIAQVIIGAAGVLLSILVHELGHAFTFRQVFRTPCTIVLHGFGGMAIPSQHRRGYGFSWAVAECFLAFSGPLAGFVLAVFTFMLLQTVPANLELFRFFLQWTTVISIVWGIFNLLPIYPMDGGHIAREVCVFFFPHRGIEVSLILSMTIAVLLIPVAYKNGSIYIALIFAYFAYQNYQEYSTRSFRH